MTDDDLDEARVEIARDGRDLGMVIEAAPETGFIISNRDGHLVAAFSNHADLLDYLANNLACLPREPIPELRQFQALPSPKKRWSLG